MRNSFTQYNASPRDVEPIIIDLCSPKLMQKSSIKTYKKGSALTIGRRLSYDIVISKEQVCYGKGKEVVEDIGVKVVVCYGKGKEAAKDKM